MGQFHDRMVADMKIRGLSESTRQLYARVAYQFVAFFRRPPTQLGTTEVRGWLLFLLTVLGRGPSTVNVSISALRFPFGTTLGKADVITPSTLPDARLSGNCQRDEGASGPWSLPD